MLGRRKIPAFYVLLLLLALVPASSARSAERAVAAHAWTPIAPESGFVRALAVDPRSGQLFATTDTSGIYRSDDRGQTWVSVNQELPTLFLNLAAGPGVVYAWAGDALYKSTDGGVHWGTTGYSGTIRSLAIVSSDPDTLYLANNGLRKSEDGGATWQDLSPALPVPADASANTVAVDPGDPDIVYAATIAGPFLKSVDGGHHWSVAGNLPSAIFYAQLQVDPGNPAILYVLGNGLLRSTDRGATWSRIDGALPRDGSPVSLAAVGGPTPRLYVTFYRFGARLGLLYGSADHGATWTLLRRAPYLPVVAVDPGHPRRVYLGTTQQGLLWSANYGTQWTQGRGLLDVTGIDVAADPFTPGTLYLVTSLGLRKSVDSGATWTSLSQSAALYYQAFNRVRPDPRTPGTLYAAAGQSLFKSSDGGATWVSIAPGSGLMTEDLAIDPKDPRYLLLAGWAADLVCNGIDCVAVARYRAAKSADGGATWTSFADTLVSADEFGQFTGVRFDPVDSRNAYLIGPKSFKSTDGGLTWTPLSLASLTDLVIDPSHPATLYAATPSPVKSTDGGQSWQPLSGLPVGVRHLALDPHAPGTVYAAAVDSGVWVSTDGGGHWSRVGSGLPRLPLRALAVDPLRAGHLLAAVPGFGGLYTYMP